MRMDPKARKAQFLQAGLELSEKSHYLTLCGNEVARYCGAGKGLPWKYFKSLKAFRRSVLREAIKRENLPIIAQMMLARDSALKSAPPELLKAAMDMMGEPYGLRN